MRYTALASQGESLYWLNPHLTSETHHGNSPLRPGFSCRFPPHTGKRPGPGNHSHYRAGLAGHWAILTIL